MLNAGSRFSGSSGGGGGGAIDCDIESFIFGGWGGYSFCSLLMFVLGFRDSPKGKCTTSGIACMFHATAKAGGDHGL